MGHPIPTQLLDRTYRLLDPALRGAAGRLRPSMRDLVGYHFGWVNDPTPTGAAPAAGPARPGGKVIRPTLTLLAAEAVGAPAARALPAAVAVELVHNASLLHDDVIDADRTRRNRPTVWSVFGVPAAILAGDALFFLAAQVLCDAPSPLSTVGLTWLNDTVQHLLDGEHADVVLAERGEVGLAECQAMASAKTSSLIACSCALGALAGGGEEAQVHRLRGFGQHLGIAFQLVDDLIGIWGDPAHTGRPALTDLRARRQSLPVAAARDSGTAEARELAHLYRTDRVLEETDLRRAAVLIEAAGGRRWAIRRARRHVELALGRLNGDGLHATSVTQLTVLARLVLSRIPETVAREGTSPRETPATPQEEGWARSQLR